MSSSGPSYERFTDRARRVMILANQEALRFRHEYIGTEHILLGLVADVNEGSGVAANVLKSLGVDLRTIRLEVEKIVQSGPDAAVFDRMPQTPRAKKVIEFAVEEARNLNPNYVGNYVGTEHLLLGLVREEEGVAAQVLMALGLGLEDVRAELLHLLGRGPQPQLAPSPLPAEDVPDYPAAIRQATNELDARMAELNGEKEAAVAAQDFELAAHLRDQGDKLKQERRKLIRTWHLDYALDPAWLTWNGGAAVKVAETIGAERRWEDLPVLADALEEAGCTHAELLAHCRAGARHARRCWVVDLLRGAV
jgi:ATP-dependent Clp protease ATP-binding subunit ClpA